MRWVRRGKRRDEVGKKGEEEGSGGGKNCLKTEVTGFVKIIFMNLKPIPYSYEYNKIQIHSTFKLSIDS